jgi:hypothetical protein
VHLSLFARSRRRQMDALARRIEEVVPADAPLLIAGDFNDWRNHADDLLAERLGLVEVFAGDGRRPSRSYPAALPLFRLDRIYQRGLEVGAARVHAGPPWSGDFRSRRAEPPSCGSLPPCRERRLSPAGCRAATSAATACACCERASNIFRR